MIVANELRSAFSSWTDRVIALAVLVIALVAVRSALSARPFIFAAAAIAILATAAGAAAAGMIERRLDFHAQDGVLPAYALAHDARRHYALPIHAMVCAIVALCAAIGRPEAALLAPIGYLIGAGVGQIAWRLVFAAVSPRRSSPLRSLRPLLQRPISGAMAALAVVLPLLLLGSIEPGPMAAFIGVISTVAALLLTSVDYKVVRFMTESGYPAGRIIGIHTRSLLMFLALSVFASLVLSDGLVALVIVGVVLAALIFMTSRILAYRIHSKRAADTFVSVSVGVACLTAFSMPMLLPVIVIAILWHLYRRSVRATWLVA